MIYWNEICILKFVTIKKFSVFTIDFLLSDSDSSGRHSSDGSVVEVDEFHPASRGHVTSPNQSGSTLITDQTLINDRLIHDRLSGTEPLGRARANSQTERTARSSTQSGSSTSSNQSEDSSNESLPENKSQQKSPPLSDTKNKGFCHQITIYLIRALRPLYLDWG